MKSHFPICSNNFGQGKWLFCASPKDKKYINGTIMTAEEMCGKTPFLKLHQIRIKRNRQLFTAYKKLGLHLAVLFHYVAGFGWRLHLFCAIIAQFVYQN